MQLELRLFSTSFQVQIEISTAVPAQSVTKLRSKPQERVRLKMAGSISGWLLGILWAVGILLFDTAAAAQQPVDAIHADDSAPISVSPTPHKRVPVFGGADEFAVAADLEYYEPQPGFDRQDRDIDLDVAQAAVAVHYREGWEFQFDGLITRNSGTAVLSSTPPIPPPVTSNAVAIGAGPMARWDFFEVDRLRFFIDGQAALILNDRPFPPHGSSYDFLLRAGGGINYRVNEHYRLEASFRGAHISNGKGVESANPTWNGRGLAIGIRRTFNPYHEPLKTPKPVDDQTAPDRAWITNLETYWASGASSAFAHQIRLLRVSYVWYLPKRIEFQLGGMIATPNANEVAGFGPLLRWNPLQAKNVRLFVDGGTDFLQTGSPAFVIPLDGVGYRFLLRTGNGVSIHLHSAYWLDSGYHFGYITTGFGPGGNSATWQGQGVSLGLRHTFLRATK